MRAALGLCSPGLRGTTAWASAKGASRPLPSPIDSTAAVSST